MALFRKLRTVTGLPGTTFFLFFKAVCLSAMVRFTLLFLPFGKVLGWLGTTNAETARDVPEKAAAYAQKVKTAIWLCNKYTPWKTECYVQALTARLLLRSRNIPSTIYIGFYRDKQQAMKGHAWLRCGQLIVTGNKTHTTFQVHAYFS